MKSKKFLWIVAGSLLLFIILIIFAVKNVIERSPVKKNTTMTTDESTLKKESKSGEVESVYEVISNTDTHIGMVLYVVTQETSEASLINLNNKLIEKYKKPGKEIFIHYFDDKKIAETYFNDIVSDRFTQKELDKKFSHYTANYKSTMKQLARNLNNSWTVIKAY